MLTFKDEDVRRDLAEKTGKDLDIAFLAFPELESNLREQFGRSGSIRGSRTSPSTGRSTTWNAATGSRPVDGLVDGRGRLGPSPAAALAARRSEVPVDMDTPPTAPGRLVSLRRVVAEGARRRRATDGGGIVRSPWRRLVNRSGR